MKQHKVHIELFISKSDCDDCGSYSMECAKITSTLKRLNTQIGSSSCCYLSTGDLENAAIFLDDELSLNLPLTKEAQAILDENEISLEDAKNSCLFNLCNEDYTEYDVDIFDTSKHNGDLLTMLTNVLAEKNMILTFEDNT